jgi:hypothetical protein
MAWALRSTGARLNPSRFPLLGTMRDQFLMTAILTIPQSSEQQALWEPAYGLTSGQVPTVAVGCHLLNLEEG